VVLPYDARVPENGRGRGVLSFNTAVTGAHSHLVLERLFDTSDDKGKYSLGCSQGLFQRKPTNS
jgi:hypothetical protein